MDANIQPGHIGAARLVRQFAQLSMAGDQVEVEAFDPRELGSDVYLASLDLEVSITSEHYHYAMLSYLHLYRSPTGLKRTPRPKPIRPTNCNPSSCARTRG